MRKQTELPLTVKIRIGMTEDREEFTNYCKFLEDMGVDGIILHTRLNKEKFCRKPRWGWGAVAKSSVKIPVLVNGGIFSVADAENCLEQSGADGLMLGRGAVIKPWLFRDIYERVYGGIVKEKIARRDIYFKFIDLAEVMFQKERRIGRVKKFTALFAESFTFGHGFAAAVQRSKTMDEIREKADVFFSHNNE